MEKNLVLRNFGIAPHCVRFFFFPGGLLKTAQIAKTTHLQNNFCPKAPAKGFSQTSAAKFNFNFIYATSPTSSASPTSSESTTSTSHTLFPCPTSLHHLHLHHIHHLHHLHQLQLYILHRSHLGVNPLRRSCVSDAQTLSEMRIFSGAASPFRTK